MEASPYLFTVKKKGSLMLDAYEALKEAICNNEVQPGDILSENRIARELGMSRTPVREAIRMLASEDYVEVRNGTGIIVKTISSDDLRDLMRVRKSLEMLAAETAVHNIQEKEIDSMEQSFLELLEDYKQVKPISVREFTSRDYLLHELLVERCGNKYVKSIMDGINANIKRFQSMSFSSLNNLPESTENHLKLLRLIRARDTAALIEALAQHIDWAKDCLYGVGRYTPA